MLPEKEGMHRSQGGLLVCPHISGEEKVGTRGGGIIEASRVVWEEIPMVRLGDFKFCGSIQSSQGEGSLIIGTVNLRGIDLG